MLASRNSILFGVKVFDCLLKTEEKRLAVDSHDSGVDDEQRYGLHILVTLVIAKSLKIDPTWNPLTDTFHISINTIKHNQIHTCLNHDHIDHHLVAHSFLT